MAKEIANVLPAMRRRNERARQCFRLLRGEMETSRDLASRLREYTASNGIPIEEDDAKFGGTWFCPCCASHLKEQKSCFRCVDCGRGFSKQMAYLIIEFHPHEKQAKS
jgi:hypothetical protein